MHVTKKIMFDNVEEWLILDDDFSQRQWLAKTYPVPNPPLLQHLHHIALHQGQNDPRLALNIAHHVTIAADFWQDAVTEAVAKHIEADAHRLKGEHTHALTLYQQAANIYQQLNLTNDVARVAIGQIDTLMYLNRYNDILVLAEQASAIFEQNGDHVALAKISNNFGNALARLARFSEALEQYAKARKTFSQTGHEHQLNILNVNEAIALTFLGEFTQARNFYLQARQYFSKAGLASITAQVDLNLAHLSFSIADYQQALSIFERARRVFSKQEDQVDVAYVDLHRSETYLALNLWREAHELATNARPVFQNAGMDREVALLWLNEAVALAHMHQVTSVNTAFNQARQIFTHQGNEGWLAITDLYEATFHWQQAKLHRAKVTIQQALPTLLKMGFHTRVAQCYILLGEIALLEDEANESADYFQKALDTLGHNYLLPSIIYASQFGLGRVAQQHGETEIALSHYRQAIANIEQLQATIGAEDYKIAFWRDKLQVYETLTSLCLTLQTSEAIREAFATVERAKSRALLDTMARLENYNQPTEEDGLTLAVNTLRQELNWYYNQLNDPNSEATLTPYELTQAIHTREKTLRQLLNEWRSPDRITKPYNPIGTVTASQLQTVLPADALVLEFYISQEDVIVFGVSSDTIWVEQLTAVLPTITHQLKQLRFQMNKFHYGSAYRQRHQASLYQSTNEHLQQLYLTLFAPLIHHLQVNTLIIVPHGILHYIPFHALFDGKQYLIDNKTISYAPSATVLYRNLLSEPTITDHSALVLGVTDPTIPYAQEEAEKIAALFDKVDLRIHEHATIDTGWQTNGQLPSVVHLATHATFRPENPLFSGLKLADRWLTVYDIYEMGHAPPIVTLSACETGRHQITFGDELIGLCRGFFALGSQSLVVSLWSVEDRSTADLMEQFYINLQASYPINRALQLAQLQIKQEKPHPYYWAPFMLMGSFYTQFK